MRETGGLGDMLMHRQMFEDIKLLMPDAELHFACPKMYHESISDHPFVDKLLDSYEVNAYDYVASHITTCACTRYEKTVAPLSLMNRSDIWAGHCGLKLTKHDMHINLTKDEAQYGINTLKKINAHYPAVAFCPTSAMVAKNLTDYQIEESVRILREMGCFVYSIHVSPIKKLNELNVPVITNQSIRQWMGVLNAADYIVSVDTASFHFGGGIKKPLIGIFTFADGKTYGKYYDFILIQKHRDNGDWDCGPCYMWGNCPKSKKNPRPCLTEIDTPMIVDGIKKMFCKWPQTCKTITTL